MKAIIDNKIYDTETAELIFSCLHKYKTSSSWFDKIEFTDYEKEYIYKTKKGNYFIYFYDGDFSSRNRIEVISEIQVKELIRRLNPDDYVRLFGNSDLEEA